MKRFLFIGGFGFLPLWTAIIIVFFGSFKANNSGLYWAAAPWLIVGSIPLCVVTLAIAFATLAIYSRVAGDPSRKRRVAFMSFVGFIVLTGAAVVALWLVREKDRQVLAKESQLAVEFVKRNSEVMKAAGGYGMVDLISSSMSHGAPDRYDISVSGEKIVYAIVDVSRSAGGTTFTLACITPLSLGQRDPYKDECKQ